MRRLAVLIVAFGQIILAMSAYAQQPLDSRSRPGVWYDIMKPPVTEAPYGLGFTSTQRVVERCTSLLWSVRTDKDGNIIAYERDYNGGYCLGWINATMAFLNFHDEAGNHTLGVCMPEDLDSVHVIEAFLDYVHQNVELTKYNPSLLMYWALLEKYPCFSQ